MSDSKTKQQFVQHGLCSLVNLMQRPDPRYLVDGLLVEGTLSLMTGKHASYKSFIALDIAMSVATGRSVFGMPTNKGNVVYVAAEGANGLKRRANAWCHHYNEPIPENFDVFGNALQITDAELRGHFLDSIGQRDLIILDTLAMCAVGLEENNATDMGKFVQATKAISTTAQAHVLIVHHNNKGDTYRGSSALPAGVDTHILIKRDEKQHNKVSIAVDKQKDDEERDPIKLIAVPAHDSLILQLDHNLTEKEQAIINTLANGPVTYAELLKSTPIPSSTFNRTLGALQNKKIVHFTLNPQDKTKKIYHLLPTPTPL